MRKTLRLTLEFLMVAWGASLASAADNSVNITHDVKAVEVTHLGRKVLIERNPDTENMLDPDYSLTSRPCPPFCVQPMNLGPGIETIGELELIEYIGKAGRGGLWNFENAKTLVLYCNGPWCGQSPTNIKQLLALGYPAHKLKWYRGGMQDWKMLGLTTVPPN